MRGRDERGKEGKGGVGVPLDACREGGGGGDRQGWVEGAW